MTTENQQPVARDPLGSNDAEDALVFEFDAPATQREAGAASEEQRPEDGAANATHERDPGVDLDHDDDDDDDSQRGVMSEEEQEAATQEEREQIRRNKKNRNQRRSAKMEAMERTIQQQQREIAEFRQRFLTADNQNVATQYAQLQQAEAQHNEAITRLKAVIADATSKGDGNTVGEATEQMALVINQRDQLAARRVQFEQAAQAYAQQQRRPHIDPVAVGLATAWRQRNPWYKGADSPEQDSAILTAIDKTLIREGFNPAHKEYWEELDARGARVLPHRFASAQGYTSGQPNARTPRTPVPTGGQPASQPSRVSPKQFKLNEERVRQMKEAGIWDDEVERKKQIEYYKRYDAQNGAR